MTYNDVEKIVDDAISTIGKNIILGLPIAVGKPTVIANEFYRRAKADPSIKLTMMSGLTLQTPAWNSDIERRLIQPLSERLFGGYPDPVYMRDAHAGKLPANVDLQEIYLSPGTGLGKPAMQQGYMSSNYTHVARDIEAAGCNAMAIMVSEKSAAGKHSTGSNADATVMQLWDMNRARAAGRKVAILAQVNRNMPYMYGAGECSPDEFTGILDCEAGHHPIFAPPKEPITVTDYSIGFHVSALIKDGGTFQVGFGSLADAIVYALQLRHEKNDVYRRIVRDTKVDEKFMPIIQKVGGEEPFEKGLYGCSEFIFDGFIRLMDSGIIKRRVYDHPILQSLLNEGVIGEEVTADNINVLLDRGIIGPWITEEVFRALRKFGIFKDNVAWNDGCLVLPNGDRIPADMRDIVARNRVVNECLGDKLTNGLLIHAGFFIGSRWFYDQLMNMDDARRREIKMREISFVNQIPGQDELKLLQRLHGRFVNTAMMATVLGGVASDTLDNNQVISGVGGQFNFVSMGHEIPGARSIIVVRSVRAGSSGPESNIVFSVGNLTIPRHLRDIFVTEYGIADVRGKTDRDTIIEILKITDSRFQQALLKKAKENSKVPADYQIPLAFRGNMPEAVANLAKPFIKEGLFPTFPYGTELTKEELALAKALRGLKARLTPKGFRPTGAAIGKTLKPPAAARPYLERMKLDSPADRKEKIIQKLVLYALAEDGVI